VDLSRFPSTCLPFSFGKSCNLLIAQPASRPQRFVKICNGGAATFAADDGSRPHQVGHRRGRPASFPEPQL
jgi:hypothetical protein